MQVARLFYLYPHSASLFVRDVILRGLKIWIIGIASSTLWGRVGIDIRVARMHFVVQPPSRFLQAQVMYELRASDATLVWDFGKRLKLTGLYTSLPLVGLIRDTVEQTLTILSRPFLPEERHWIQVSYEGEPLSSGFGSFEVKAHETGYVLWTLSEPYGARDWLFCQNDLSDKVDTLFISVETPPDYIGVANGRLLADSLTSRGTRIRHFQHNYPIATYLIAIAASNYVVQHYTIQTPFHTYTLQNYVFPQDTGRARELTEFMRPYFSWIEEQIGPYPFADEGYNQVQIGWGGGMEHQTITFFGSYSPELWAHELAHQWFGDLVTCGSWQDIWLNEAFATLLGGKVYAVLPTGLWERWRYLVTLAAWRDPTQTIFVADTTHYERIFSYPTTYAKGALALEMLREYLHDEPFWQGLRQYLQEHRYGFARTADFQRSVQSFWGQEISRAFVQSWIYTPGFPEVKLVWETPSRFTMHSNHSYPMRVPIHIRYAQAPDSVQILHLSLLEPETVTLSHPIQKVAIDPDTTTPYYRPRLFLPPNFPPLIYPNPTFGILHIVHSAPSCHVFIYDDSGRLQGSQSAESSTLQISLSPLSAGIYHVIVETPEGIHREKVIKINP